MHRIFNRSFFLAVAFVGLFQFSGRAQTSARDYIFSQLVEPMRLLTQDTVLGSGFQDDVVYMSRTLSATGTSSTLSGPGFPIGFPFEYDGQTFTRFGFSSNGYIKLGNGTFTIQNSLSSAFTSDSTNQINIISALHGDIMTLADVGAMSYQTIGAPGSRQLVVQYKDMRHYVANVVTTELFTFQIILSEGSNTIRFVYGTMLKDATDRTYTVGIKGRFFNLFHTRTGADWGASTRSTELSNTILFRIGLEPEPGLTYIFQPREFDNDLSMDAILQPTAGVKDCFLSQNESVSLRLKNTGRLEQTAANVGFRTSTGQIVTQPVTFTPPLLRQQTRDVTITTPANLSGLNPPSLKVFVALATEEQAARSNDTMMASFTLGRPFENFAISNFDSLILRNWVRGRGAATPAPGFSLWRKVDDLPPPANSTGLYMPLDTPLVKNEWIYSPSYRVDPAFNFSIRFRAAIFSGFTGTSPITDIGDDTIKLMISTDCRNTWRTLRAFNTSSLTSGQLNNAFANFQIPLPEDVNGLVTVAFMGKNNGNTSSTNYRFVFNNFRFIALPRYDLSADTLRIPSVISRTCRYGSQEPVFLRVTNRGFATLDSTDAGFFINSNLTIRRKFAFNPPLQPGQSTNLIFDGNAGADMSVSESQFVTAFVALRQQAIAQRFNDTIRRSFNLAAPSVIPTPIYNTYISLLNATWQRGRGANAPVTNSSSWGERSIDAQQTAGVDFRATPGLLQEWLYSVAYAGPSRAVLNFKAAVTAIGSSSPATGMNSDSIKVLISVDCGASWRAIRTFSGADLANGSISNRLREYSFELFNSGRALIVGFAGFRQANGPSTNGFTFHVDSISITTPQFPDMAAPIVMPGLVRNATCPGSESIPLGVVVRNAGTIAVTSATVGYVVNSVPRSRVVNFSGAGLAPGALDTISFTGTEAPVYNAVGNYNFKGFVRLTGEDPSTSFNDSSSLVRVVILPTQAVPLTETFQINRLLPSGWLSDTVTGRGFKIALGRGPSGTQALNFRAQGAFTTGQVITRNLGPINAEGNILNLSYRTLDQGGSFFRLRPGDYIEIFASTDCGNTFTSINRLDSAEQAVVAGFLTLTTPLDAYNGQVVSLKIEAKLTPRGITSNFLDISRFAIERATDVLAQPLQSTATLYPNPLQVGDNVTIEGDMQVKTAYVLSASGQQLPVNFTQTAKNTHIVHTSGLKAGMYVLVLKSANGWFSRKIVVNK